MPTLKTEVVLTGRQHVWDIGFLPTGEMLFTERGGTLSLLKDGQAKQLAAIADVRVVGEGGLLGLAIDPEFTANRQIYTCFNTKGNTIHVVRWAVTADLSGLEKRSDIITDMPDNVNSGRHSGCRLAFGPDGYLWIGTGDTGQALGKSVPQDPKSLGGKVLRVTRDGKGAPGNVGGEFDARIYSYGHRNIQGLAFFASPVSGVLGINAEHGTDKDDEVNPLKAGNFGWGPPAGTYDQSVPMTDKTRFPDAIDALWASGDPTEAPSGAAVLKGKQWKLWDGAVVLAMLKDERLKVLTFDNQLKLTSEEERLKGEFGRLRAAVMGIDGSLYLSTSNGSDDKIIRVTPRP